MSEAARVLIVDDSRIYRAAIEQVLSGQEDLAVAGSVFSGAKALECIRQHPPDVVTLDVEMPGMNGLEVLQAIQEINRGRTPATEIGVLMVSAYTRRGADVSMQALQAGAFDVVAKPSEATPAESLAALSADLLPKIRAFLSRRKRIASRTINWNVGTPTPRAAGDSSTKLPGAARESSASSLRAPRTRGAVLIAASTGGPQALARLLPDLTARTLVPILVVQHMPAGFTRSLAESLARVCSWPVVEAADNQPILPGNVLIAPGGKHLVVRLGPGGQKLAGLTEQPPESGCRPSASVLFRSAAAIYGADAVGVVLTGMGNDGTAGLSPLKRAGASVIAQDEDSSVVWGMPGSAVAANLVDVVAPLERVASEIASALAKQGRT